MKVFVAGSTGATGRKLTEQLLERGHQVVTVVRSSSSLPEAIRDHANLNVTKASLLDLSDAQLQELVQECDAVASCLGHTLTFKGMFGRPHYLVRDAARRLCEAVKANKPQTPVKFVLMNTTGNHVPKLDQPVALGEKIVTGLMYLLLPPHRDNVAAANYLQTHINTDENRIEWCAVRPDDLIDEGEVTEYSIHPAPIRSALFDAGKTSRINVGHFMAELITDETLWQQWKRQLPVIYNLTDSITSG